MPLKWPFNPTVRQQLMGFHLMSCPAAPRLKLQPPGGILEFLIQVKFFTDEHCFWSHKVKVIMKEWRLPAMWKHGIYIVKMLKSFDI